MREINLTADELVKKLVNLDEVCLLDSCGVNHLGSHLLIAGINPIERLEIANENPNKTLEILDKKFTNSNYFNIFTISYDFGLKLENIKSRHISNEPDVFIATFDVLIIHDYNTHKTYLIGEKNKFDDVEILLNSAIPQRQNSVKQIALQQCNFTENEYISAIEKNQDYIRNGDTYQTNLTRQITVKWEDTPNVAEIFLKLRENNPTPFASFIKRQNDVVISASPERFFEIEGDKISTSPIKGTRPRGKNLQADLVLRNELVNSEKDRAENVMIVDLLRNDLGRICEFGTVKVKKLCDLEEHPTLFHLVSTISGDLCKSIKFSDLLKAVFPCGSITGCPKIRTMKIIDEIEPASRGLSMGAIGFATSKKLMTQNSQLKTLNSKLLTQNFFSLNVAIRTMVIRQKIGIFNVGGGIVIDSIPDQEYNETIVKSKALLDSI